MNPDRSPGRQLRGLMARGGVVLPGAFNALTAKLIERLGFQGVYISGAGLTASAGYPDIGLLTLSEVLSFAGYIARATTLPCICDADTGFGEAVNVARTVTEFERIGTAGIHIEDQIFPKRCGHLAGKMLISREEMAQKIETATLSRRDNDFLIIARTDARSVEGLQEAIRRAEAYVEAGADVIFPEALQSREEFLAFAGKVTVPLVANMTEFGVSPLLSADELIDMGYRLIIYPVGALRMAMKACERFYVELRDSGTQRDLLEAMQTRAELYSLLDYDRYARLDRKVAGYARAAEIELSEEERKSDE